MTARFITFEGGEGAGKSTQIRFLEAYLHAQGINVVTTREPGGSVGAEAIRNLVVTGEQDRWLPVSEILLFAAARFDHVERIIKPALTSGQWVLCDRFFDSTLAYQGYGYQQDKLLIDQVRRLTLGDFEPDLTIVFDVDPETGLSRAGEKQRYETMDLEFHKRLRLGFQEIAKSDPDRCTLIDTSQPWGDVQGDIIQALHKRILS